MTRLWWAAGDLNVLIKKWKPDSQRSVRAHQVCAGLRSTCETQTQTCTAQECSPWFLSCGGFSHKQINMQSWHRVWGQRFGKKECLCGELRDAAETSRQRGTEETLEERWDLRTRRLWRLFIVDEKTETKFCSQPAGVKVDLLWFWQLPLLLLASCVEITHRWHVLHCCWLH